MCGGQEEGQWHTDSIRHHYTPFKSFHWWHDERGNYNKCLQSLTILFKGTVAGFYHTLTGCCSFLVHLWAQLLFSVVFRYPNNLWLWVAVLLLSHKQVASVADTKKDAMQHKWTAPLIPIKWPHMGLQVIRHENHRPTWTVKSNVRKCRLSAMHSFWWTFLD